MLTDEGTIQSYHRVERLDCKFFIKNNFLLKIKFIFLLIDPVQRPVLVVGPLSDWVVDKLTIDFPQQFQRCSVTPMNCNQETVENMKQNNIIVDYRIRGNIFEVTTVKSIRDVCESVSEIRFIFIFSGN